ncbi:MAG: hypothetical protein ACR2PZ_21865 [Pseudomonadales bacterium]
MNNKIIVLTIVGLVVGAIIGALTGGMLPLGATGGIIGFLAGWIWKSQTEKNKES